MSDRPVGIPVERVDDHEIVDVEGTEWDITGIDGEGRLAVEGIVGPGRRRACAIYSDGVLVKVAEGDTFTIHYSWYGQSGPSSIVTTLVASRDHGWGTRITYEGEGR